MTFPALFVHDTAPRVRIRRISADDLPSDGDTLVRVAWSGINYKDALAVKGHAPIIRGALPFIPGIDLSGEILETSADEWRTGDCVLQTGWGLGETQWGAYSGVQRVHARHLVRLPTGLSSKHAMIAGTAGFTAVLAVIALEEAGITPESGDIVVTGASGGVGTFAVMALAHAGYRVVASSGSASNQEYLESMGASRVMDRSILEAGAARPLDSGHWAGAIDTVGGTTLEALISQTARHGCVAACGLVGGEQFSSTVYPFILRGIRLQGIDSNTCPNIVRRKVWKRIAVLTSVYDFDSLAEEVPFGDIEGACKRILAGGHAGRMIVSPSEAAG
ncbi:MAG: oxidoreductase [Bacteroidetes bacterium CG12_big_fil_rev_8_21_14_0_65_60_17]|nr:MAG: oxidoreductase [Bacteroidetes bacterium CG12_big_fil_rev_8_21_14_0_65_60_17]